MAKGKQVISQPPLLKGLIKRGGLSKREDSRIHLRECFTILTEQVPEEYTSLREILLPTGELRPIRFRVILIGLGI